METLDDKTLIEIYIEAKKLYLAEDFINLIEIEIKRRGLEDNLIIDEN